MDSGGVRHTASPLRNVRPVLKRPGEGSPSRIKRKEKYVPEKKNIKSKYVIIVSALSVSAFCFSSFSSFVNRMT